MEYLECRPSRLFSPYVKLYWSLEYDRCGETSDAETVLPDGCPEIVFNLSDRFVRLGEGGVELQPVALFAGQMTKSIAIRPTGAVRLFGVRFQPYGAVRVLKIPMNELSGRIVDLGSVLGRGASELESRIREASSFEGRISEFERCFLEKAVDLPRQNDLAACAAGILATDRGAVPISRLSERLGVSERRLERTFMSQIGISPKTLARIMRFQAFVSLIQQAKTPAIVDRSLEIGYYDQSHATRDFREFSGMTPLGYFQTTHRLSDAFTGAYVGERSEAAR